MKTTASFVAGAVLVAALAAPRESKAEDSYAAPLVGVTGAFGARGGWGGPDAAIASLGLFAGERWGASGSWRAGALGDTSPWRADPRGVAIDFGGFISGDIEALWLDPSLSAAWFLRVAPMLRWVSSTSRWALAPALGTGIRVAGFEIGVVGQPEFGLEAVPNGGSTVGINVECQLGVDFVELAAMLGHFSDANLPLAP